MLDKENRAKEVAVTAGRKLGDLVEVTGVKAGDKVALAPPEKLRDGGAVALLKK